MHTCGGRRVRRWGWVGVRAWRQKEAWRQKVNFKSKNQNAMPRATRLHSFFCFCSVSLFCTHFVHSSKLGQTKTRTKAPLPSKFPTLSILFLGRSKLALHPKFHSIPVSHRAQFEPPITAA